MINIRSISPLARSIGTMGVVAGLVGAVTFANLTSNTVALTPNNVTVANASLLIGDQACAGLNAISQPGFAVTNLAPGSSSSISFCIANDGDVPLALGATVSDVASGLDASLAAQATTLTVTCGGDPSVSGTLATGWTTVFPTALGNGLNRVCTATVDLSGSFGGNGGDVIPPFSINFTGTQP